MHKCLEQCEFYKKVKNTRLCTYELGGKLKIGYRSIPSKKKTTIPPLWCPLRKKKKKKTQTQGWIDVIRRKS